MHLCLTCSIACFDFDPETIPITAALDQSHTDQESLLRMESLVHKHRAKPHMLTAAKHAGAPTVALCLHACLPCSTVFCDSDPGDISQAAEEALKQGTEQQSCSPSEDPSPAQGGPTPSMGWPGWKGQQGVIPDLVHLWVAWSPSPCQTLLGLLQGALTQVPSLPLTGKKAQEPVVYPGTV